jgi:hypothetical protein
MTYVALHIRLDFTEPTPPSTEVTCTHCSSFMTKGLALINPFEYRFNYPKTPQFRLMDCLKCRVCGKSEALPGSETHYLLPGDITCEDYA